MKLYEIQPLLQDMGRNQARIDKFRFQYNQVEFEVIVLLERTPFEMLFGVIGHNFSFVLNLYKGYELEELSDETFYRLCNILNLKPGKEGLTSFKFLKYFAQRIPEHYSGRSVQPHEVAIHKSRNVSEADKIYFCGWRFYTDSERHARNFEKTKKWLGDEAYEFCKIHDISSCWTDKLEKRKDYYTPQTYHDNYKKQNN